VSRRTVRRFVEGLLRGQRTARARPDDFEAREMKTAIDLRAARLGSDSPREEFVTDLHRRLADGIDSVERSGSASGGTRRQIVLGTSIAAASAAAGIVVDRTLLRGPDASSPPPPAQGVVEPNTGAWRPVGASADVDDGRTLAFDLGTVRGFVHRVNAQLEAVSGICTHQGCRLWLDVPENRLRCPCHSTSFSLAGRPITHQLPIAPPPLPRLQVREIQGVIEIFAPDRSN
jgi:cytochrome b6-f complex iron-sulfur subunit